MILHPRRKVLRTFNGGWNFDSLVGLGVCIRNTDIWICNISCLKKYSSFGLRSEGTGLGLTCCQGLRNTCERTFHQYRIKDLRLYERLWWKSNSIGGTTSCIFHVYIYLPWSTSNFAHYFTSSHHSYVAIIISALAWWPNRLHVVYLYCQISLKSALSGKYLISSTNCSLVNWVPNKYPIS